MKKRPTFIGRAKTQSRSFLKTTKCSQKEARCPINRHFLGGLDEHSRSRRVGAENGRSDRALSERSPAKRSHAAVASCGRNTSASSATKPCYGSRRSSGLQPINILELVTFYPMFRQKPAGKTHIRVCRTLSCAMAGGFELMENLCADAWNPAPTERQRNA